MLAAAALTGLDIEVPEQPYNTDQFVHAFQQIGHGKADTSRPGYGSARAWLAHLDMMKHIIASGLTSAFVVEDDIDWDIGIRAQMRLISDNVRRHTQTPYADSSPFGHGWDVLWLGHCGDELAEDHLAYADSTIRDVDIVTAWDKKWAMIEGLAPGHRAVQTVQGASCTFGYGVTHAGATKILQFLGAGQDEAFDVEMMHQCEQGHLQCLSVLPELMHHYTPHEGLGYVSPNEEGNGVGQSTPDEAFESIMGGTANVRKSARCMALFGMECVRKVL